MVNAPACRNVSTSTSAVWESLHFSPPSKPLRTNYLRLLLQYVFEFLIFDKYPKHKIIVIFLGPLTILNICVWIDFFLFCTTRFIRLGKKSR